MSNFFRSLKHPLFMPDATYGIVKTLSWNDLNKVGTQAIVTNTLHVYMNIGDKYINDLGGFKKFSGWNGGVITDSGGFQAYSLIKKGLGKMFDDYIEFNNPLNGNKYVLTPEDSIKIQLNLRSDVVIVLDDCIHPDSSLDRIEESVNKTTKWAKICKKVFVTELKKIKEYDSEYDPLIFCVIQGGKDLNLRKRSFTELFEIGFDGFGFGGWPTDEKGNFLDELLEFNASLVKGTNKFNYAMGVGYPKDIIKCLKWGYNLFDCVIPTRNARHGILYSYDKNGRIEDSIQEIRIENSQYLNDITPIKIDSKIPELQETSKAFLKHLFKIKDPLAYRLATLNNLEVFNQIVKNSQQ